MTNSGILGDFHLEVVDHISENGWASVPNWGSEGWDLGQWPYAIVAATRTADCIGNLFGVASYCEGDVTTAYYRTQRGQWQAITGNADYAWKNGQAHGPDDLPEAAAELPARDRAPYPGWASSH